MPLIAQNDRSFLKALSKLAFCNPFLPERIEYEREALGEAFVDVQSIWSKRAGEEERREPNVEKLIERVQEIATRLRESIARGARPDDEERALFEDLILFLLFHRYANEFQRLILEAQEGRSSRSRVAFFRAFLSDYEFFFGLPLVRERPSATETESGADTADSLHQEAAHVFAAFFQVRRAFHHIYECIVGRSMPLARLRAAIWQSVFTHDMRRYRRSLYKRMADMTCLVTGPSGTGKELVARAIGLARYIPFDPASASFQEDFAGSFYALSVSALSPTLIESELFGHRKGAFTGALQDRAGWFEVCPPLGTVFLDEVGEIDPAIQVKLLRVLQTRSFQRLGDSKDRRFLGKIIAATNRNLGEEMSAGRFRADLYYRICSDVIVTPSLREQLDSSDSAGLGDLLYFISKRLVGDREAAALAAEAEDWIRRNLGDHYPWPGNVRELEQCVSSILIRRSYRPAETSSPTRGERLAKEIERGNLTADDLLKHYCTLIYARTGSYQETARRLQLDHRTVKSKVLPDLLEEMKGES
ncbi:sigma-54 factor interaction domain-containing protein [Candidatus Sumerlaeota bacterium]|nr:sigma-54 factor interaction domain-containing protein [Candidatus Sumerlaeota bacterium]